MLLLPFRNPGWIINLLSVDRNDLVVGLQSRFGSCGSRLNPGNGWRNRGQKTHLAERFALPAGGLRLFKFGIQFQDLIASSYFETDGCPFTSHDVPGNAIDHPGETSDGMAVDRQNLVAGDEAGLGGRSISRYRSDGRARFSLWHWAANCPHQSSEGECQKKAEQRAGECDNDLVEWFDRG